MDIQLISGTFTVAEAETLLTAIFKTKISFHENKIGIVHESEEDIKHSESKIKLLEKTLRDAVKKIKENGQTHTNMHAHINVNPVKKVV